MKEAAAIVGYQLWQAMREVYLDWIRQDSYGGTVQLEHELQHMGVPSIQWLISAAAAGEVQDLYRGVNISPLPTLDMTFDEWMGAQHCLVSGQWLPYRNFVPLSLCLAHLPELLYEARLHLVDSGRTDPMSDPLRWSETLERAVSGQSSFTLISALFELVEQELQHKSLWDFFRTPVAKNGYLLWSPPSLSGLGELKDSSFHEVDGARVGVQVSHHSHIESTVQAYEFAAELRLDAAHEADTDPGVVLCGVAYAMQRKDQALISTPEEFRQCAQMVAGDEIALVNAFFGQHRDAAQRMQAGDVAVLWLWERRQDTARGLGAQCLAAALRNLKERFPALATLVVGVLPPQYLPQLTELEPPQMQVARIEACEELEQFISGLELGRHFGGEVRLVRASPGPYS